MYSSPTNHKSRIDKIYLPSEWIGKIVSTKFENISVSDHKIVITKIRNEIQKGQGVYVFNNSLLEDPVFIQGIYDIIAEYSTPETDLPNWLMHWDFLKQNLTDFAKRFSKEKSNNEKKNYQ